MEHYCTLFDYNFSLSGISLYRSLEAVGEPFCLWVIAMDTKVAVLLDDLDLPHLKVIALSDIETDAHLAVKQERTFREYCWTMTCFTLSAVFERAPDIKRVTYLDADMFFFNSARPLFDELETAGKDILITSHGYAPEYEQGDEHGKYCVQFLTANNSEGGHKVLAWWQARCLEWCFDRVEPGRFGDQKYLDEWPERFAAETHVYSGVRDLLAPWNLAHFHAEHGGYLPVTYHFHGLRLVSRDKLQLCISYKTGNQWRAIYDPYVEQLREAAGLITGSGCELPVLPQTGLRNIAKLVFNQLRGTYLAVRF